MTWTSAILRPDRVERAFVVLVGAAVVVPMTLDSYLSGTKSLELVTQQVTTPTLARLATLAGHGAVMLATLLVLVLHRADWRRLLGRATLLLAAWVVAAVQMVAMDNHLTTEAFLFPAVVVTIAMLRPGRAAAQAAGAVVTGTAVLSLLMGLLTPAAGRYVRPESLAEEKFVAPWGIFAGPFPSGNNLGVALAMGLPLVLTFRRTAVRWGAAAAVLVAIATTSSRTAIIAAVVTAACWAVIRLVRGRRSVVAVGLSLVGVVWVALPLLTRRHTAFTNRGGYWVASLHAWGQRPWFGWGQMYFQWLSDHGAPLGKFAYHAHNQLVQLLVTGGLVLTLLTVAALIWSGVRAVRIAPRQEWPALILVAFAAGSLFEVPIGFIDRSMYLPFALLPLCLVLLGRRLGEPAAVR